MQAQAFAEAEHVNERNINQPLDSTSFAVILAASYQTRLFTAFRFLQVLKLSLSQDHIGLFNLSLLYAVTVVFLV